MGQNSSKRRSYTPGQAAASELPSSKVNGDAKVNGSIEVHEEDLDPNAPTSPTSVTSGSSSASKGKKEKKKKMKFIGFSFRRTSSGKWTRKRRNNPAPNGTARPVSCPNPIKEHLDIDPSTGRPQSFILEEFDIAEEDNKIETVDLSDQDEEGKSKQTPKATTRTKGKQGSLKKKGSGKKKKEKKNSKKDKPKKKKPAPEPTTQALKEQTKPSETEGALQTATEAKADASVDQNKGSTGENLGLEAMASSIVQESVAVAQKRLMDESETSAVIESPEVSAEIKDHQNMEATNTQAASSIEPIDVAAEVTDDTTDMNVAEIPPPEPFADTEAADVSLVDEVINAIKTEHIEAALPKLKEQSQVLDGQDGAEGVAPTESEPNGDMEFPNKPVVADIVADIEQDISTEVVSSSFVANVDVAKDAFSKLSANDSNEQTEATPTEKAEAPKDAQSTLITSISQEAVEAVSVAEKAESEIQCLVASPGTSEGATEVSSEPSDMSAEGNKEICVNGNKSEEDSAVEKIVEEVISDKETVKETCSEAAVDVPSILAVAAEVSHGKVKVEKSLSLEKQKAQKAEQEREKREKEKLEREKVRKQKEEERAKDKERIKQEKKKKAEQKAAEKAGKEKTKEKKNKVSKRLSQLFSKKENTKTDIEIKTPDEDNNPAQRGAEMNPAEQVSTEVTESTQQKGVDHHNVPALSTEDVPAEPPSGPPPDEEAENSSLTIDVSVEPLNPQRSVSTDVSNLEVPSPPSSETPSSEPDSAPASPRYDDSLDQEEPTSPESDGANGASGVLKKISIGPRLRTAILRKKSSGASDSGQDDKKVALTTPVVIECADITLPPRKLGPRRPFEQYSPVTEGAHNWPLSDSWPAQDEEKLDEANAEKLNLGEKLFDNIKSVVQSDEDGCLSSEPVEENTEKCDEEQTFVNDSKTVEASNEISIQNENLTNISPCVSERMREQISPVLYKVSTCTLASDKNCVIGSVVDNAIDGLQTDTSDKNTINSDVINEELNVKDDQSTAVQDIICVTQQVSQECAPVNLQSQNDSQSDSENVLDLSVEKECDENVKSEEKIEADKDKQVVVEEVMEATKVTKASCEPVFRKMQDLAAFATAAVKLSSGAESDSVDEPCELAPSAQEKSDEEGETDASLPSPTVVSKASIVLRPSLTEDDKDTENSLAQSESGIDSELGESSPFIEQTQPADSVSTLPAVNISEASQNVEDANDPDKNTQFTNFSVTCAAQTVVGTAVSPIVDISSVQQDENVKTQQEESCNDTLTQLVSQSVQVMSETAMTTAQELGADTKDDKDVLANDYKEPEANTDSSPSDDQIAKKFADTPEEPSGITLAEYYIGMSDEKEDKDAENSDKTSSSGSTNGEADVTLTPATESDAEKEKFGDSEEDVEKTITLDGDENANDISSSHNTNKVDKNASHGKENGVDSPEESKDQFETKSSDDSEIEKDLNDSDDVQNRSTDDEEVVNGSPREEGKTGLTTDTIEAYLKLQNAECGQEKTDSPGGEKKHVTNGDSEKAHNGDPNCPTVDQPKVTG